MRILFMGTPEFAAVSLRAAAEAGEEIVGVFTQPDRPKNRGHRLTVSPVKAYALEKGIPVYQPESLRDGAAAELIRSLAPDVIAVAAYGKILPEEILRLPPLGCVNVHASLLPKYRGAAPINQAILDGERESGVTIMYMAKALDAGDILLQRSTEIGENEDAAALTARLADIGAQALLEVLPLLKSGTAPRTPQDGSRATYAPMLTKEMSPVDWNLPARAIHCRVRALVPWPGAETALPGGEPLKLWAAEETGETSDALPGTVTAADKRGISVVCGDGKTLLLTEVQARGKKRMAAGAYLLGRPMAAGSRLGVYSDL